MPRRSHACSHDSDELSTLLAADVGARIHQARLEKGLTLAQLGGEDYSRSFLSLVENGHSRISLRGLALIAKRLDRPISSFFTDDVTARENAADYIVSQAEIAVRESHADEALRLLESVELTSKVKARSLWVKGSAQLLQFQLESAAYTLRDALAAVDAEADPRLAGEIHYRLGQALYADQHYNEAFPIFQEGDRLARQAGDDQLRGRLTVMLGHLYSVRRLLHGHSALSDGAADAGHGAGLERAGRQLLGPGDRQLAHRGRP
jgi:transcriptional regulator with XRE-family HTH domain